MKINRHFARVCALGFVAGAAIVAAYKCGLNGYTIKQISNMPDQMIRKFKDNAGNERKETVYIFYNHTPRSLFINGIQVHPASWQARRISAKEIHISGPASDEKE